MEDVDGLGSLRDEADPGQRQFLFNGEALRNSDISNVEVEGEDVGDEGLVGEAGALGGGGGGEDDDEDIDIVDIDEEEEARVKMAMGVGEGIPLGDDEVEEGMLEEGAFAVNGDMLEGDAGLAQALAEAEAAAGVASELMAEEANAKRQRQKRRLGAEAEEEMEIETPAGGWSADVDAVRRTRQRTARPAPAKKKLRRPSDEEDLEELGLGAGLGGGGVEEEDLEQMHADAQDGEDGDPPAAAAKLRRVKFSIKSFTVPELIVALPESSTVGQLKKAVMDAAMKLLGGGLRVRVLMHGKRMHEEASSLAQAGISRATLGPGKVSDSLAFMLEPSPLYALNPGDTDPLLVLSQAIPEPAPEPPMSAVASSLRSRSKMKGRGEDDADFDEAEERRLGRGRGRGRVPQSPHTTRVAAAQALAAIRAQAEASRGGGRVEAEGLLGEGEGLDPSSGAIVLHPLVQDDMDDPHLQMVQHSQHRRSSSALMNLDGRRRIRRPFTVSEVAMLVEAVEKLGNGRCAAALTSAWWRDVKNKAFFHAKHRTYVDLKDKWKTLVHTAQIAPHQRRGEPVPPDLLERVTKAHAYWTAQLRAQQDERDGI